MPLDPKDIEDIKSSLHKSSLDPKIADGLLEIYVSLNNDVERFDQLRAIIARTEEAIPRHDITVDPMAYLPFIRAGLQFFYWPGHDEEDEGNYVNDAAQAEELFRMVTGRPFDPVADAISWEEANALPRYPTERN